MLPAHSESIIEPVGNGSLAGAYLSLIDPTARRSFEELMTKPEVLSLNLIPEFEMNYIDAMMLPHFDPNEFE